MAELEHELGIQSTYYFRFPYTFKPEIIGKINDWGHEIGYHYDVLSKAKGDYEKAIKVFVWAPGLKDCLRDQCISPCGEWCGRGDA